MYNTLRADAFFRSEEQTVTLEARMPQEPYPLHTHEFSEVVIVHRGFGSHMLNDRMMPVSAGSVLFLGREDFHGFSEVSDLRLTNIIYRLPFLETRFQNLCQENARGRTWRISLRTAQKINALLKLIANEASETSPNLLMQEGLFLQIMAILLQEKYVRSAHVSIDERAWQLLHYLCEHYLEEINWETIARLHYLSERTMHRKVKEFVGASACRYLTWLRLVHASELLIATENHITHIANNSGFPDSNHFATLFRQHFNCSPTEFRCHHRKTQMRKA